MAGAAIARDQSAIGGGNPRQLGRAAILRGDANQFAAKVAASSKAGGAIVKMVTDVNTKLGPLADEAYGSIGAQLLKLKDVFVAGFDDLDLSGLTGAIAQVTKSVEGMFGGAKKQGRSLTQSLIDGLAYGIDKINLWSLDLEAMWALHRAGQFTDLVREAHPEPQKLASWWSYRAQDFRQSNRGLRLDHILVTPGLREAVFRLGSAAARIHDDVREWERPSDHAPVSADLVLQDSAGDPGRRVPLRERGEVCVA